MTGFGRADGPLDEGGTWTWELRAVNGKSLDVRMRLPHGLEALEAGFKKCCAEKLARGNIQASLTLSTASAAAVPTINPAALDAVLAALDVITQKAPTTPSTAAEILGLRGVLELSEPKRSEEELQALAKTLQGGLSEALDALDTHRLQEGAALKSILSQHVDAIEKLTARAESDPSRKPEAIAARLKQNLALLNDGGSALDEGRLYQEAALLATKADIREELDRLKAHVNAVREHLAQGSPIGRKLEFVAQEFNRESNTLCSKSNAVAITEIGLELKVAIDQFREQVLNVE